MSHKKKSRYQHPPPAAHPPSTFRKVALTAISLSLLTPTFSAFAQYKYKAYVKDLLTNGATIVVPPQDQTGQLIITPTSYDFANTPKNSTSEAVFTVKNTSTNASANITLGSPSLSNTNGFSYVATCPAILAPQASCEIRVLFTPSTPSTFTSSLAFPSANAAVPLPSAAITGQGINSAITFSANPLNFPDTDISTTSAPQVLTITNAGSLRLPISSLSATAPYAISSNTCVDYLNPAQSCTATLTFSPTVVGPNPSLFSFNTDTQTFTTSLTGNGLGPVITITPSAITGVTTIDLTPNAAATPQSVTPQSFSPLALGTPSDPILNYKKLTSTTTITNSGTKPLTNLDLSYSASSTSSPYISSTCPTSLAAGASCTISISAYRHLKNKHTGILSLTGNAIPTKQIPVSLDISPITPTNTVISDTSSYDFGSVVVRQPSTPKRVTFSYFGDSTATLTTPSSSLLSLANNTCENATLSPGDTCSVDVSLTPTSPRPNLFTLWMPSYRIASAGSSSTPISHQFNYSGLGEALSLNPSSLSTTSTTSSSSSATYTLSNTGNRASTVSLSHAPATTSLPFSLNVTSSCSTIQPGSTCTITAVASANTEGVHTGSLTIDGSTSSLIAPSSLTVSDAPSLTLSSKSINFGTIVSGATVSPQSVVVANIGASAANLGPLSTTSPFTLSHNCPTSLSALSTCTLSFGIDTSIAAPSATTQLSSSLTLATSQPYFKTLSLSATQQGTVVNNLGELTFSPKSASFPYTPVSQQSFPKTFTIDNGNSAPYSLEITPTFRGADASQYTLSNNTCPTPIPPKSFCTVDVAYTPTSSDFLPNTEATQIGLLYEGALTLTADLFASDIPVNALTFNPLNFNTSNPPTGNNVQYYFYKNTSANSLTFTPDLQIGSHFSILNNTCSSVPAGSLCKITVHAKTDTEGFFQDTMTANGTLVTLNSTVFPFPSLNFSQYGNTITALDYGTVSHKKPLPTSNVQLNNSSTSPATLSPITFISFSGISQTNTCSGTSSTTGTLCDFNINVSPSTLASPLNADSYKWSSTLNVSTADGLATTSLPIKGTAVVGTHSLPSSINFGTLYLGQTTSQPLTITNTSTNQAEIVATAVSPDASDMTSSTPCLNTWFAPGQTCVSTLTFAPTTPGVRSGTISLGIIGKTSQSRSVPWTASILTGFATEGILSPNSWAPNTTVGTPLTQLVTFTNTYYEPLTIANPSFSSGFPAGLTIAANTCSGQTIPPQATCTMTLQFTSAVSFEKATSSTINFPLTPVNQSVSLTIPSAYATLGDPTITSLTTTSYPAGYAISTAATTVSINGTGFAIGASPTKIYVNGTQLTTTARTSTPFLGWYVTASSGATASTLITLRVPTGTSVGDYTISAHNVGSLNDPSTVLHVASMGPTLSVQQTANSSSQSFPADYTSPNLIPKVSYSTAYTHTATFKNEGGMPYTFPGTPSAYKFAGTTTTTVLYAEVSSNTCASLTALQPSESCVVVSSLISPASTAGAINTIKAIQYDNFFSAVQYLKPATGVISSTVLDVAATPVNGYSAEVATLTALNFGLLSPDTPRSAIITVKNTSSFAQQTFTPSLTGNSSFSIDTNTSTCSSAAYVAANTTCTVVILASSSTIQGAISSSLTVTPSLSAAMSVSINALSQAAATSAGIDTAAMPVYFPMTTSPVVNAAYPTTTPFRDYTGQVIELLLVSGAGYGSPINGVKYLPNTPFNPAVPSHSTLSFYYDAGYSNTVGAFYNPNQAILTGTGDFSFSAWIAPSTITSNNSIKSGPLFSQVNGTGTTGMTYSISRNSSNQICYSQGVGATLKTPTTVCSTTTVTSAVSGPWSHIAITRSGTTLTLYVNGQATTATVPLADFTSGYGFAIAKQNGSYIAQRIADIAYFTRAFTPSEVTQISNSKAPLIAK